MLQQIILMGLAMASTLCMRFSRNGYRIDCHHVLMMYNNRKYQDYYHFEYNKYNRTTRAFEIRMKVAKTQNNFEVVIDSYIFLSNEYKQVMPMHLAFDGCDAIKYNKYGFGMLKTVGNYTNCPLLPAVYQVKNFTIDSSKFPPNLPLGEYKLEMAMFVDKELSLRVAVFVEIKNTH